MFLCKVLCALLSILSAHKLKKTQPNDPYWEAADAWYWSAGDQEWHDARQVYTQNGSLHIGIDDVEEQPRLPYRSEMLQSWNKFCFVGDYIEVSLTLLGHDENTQEMSVSILLSFRCLILTSHAVAWSLDDG